MEGTRRSSRRLVVALAVAAALVVTALPAGAARIEAAKVPLGILAHLSQTVAQRYAVSTPEAVPSQHGRLAAFAKKLKTRSFIRGKGPKGGVFNADDLGLPQNEESITACRTHTNRVLGGTNDYRGLLDPSGNFTGWHYSNDGGSSLANEGLLPELSIDSTVVPSGGDPVDVATAACDLYAGSLNYVPTSDFLTMPNGIGVYMTRPGTLASCPGGADPSCWPVRRIVAASSGGNPGHFFDKEWIDVGASGSAGTVVWVTWSDFNVDLSAPLGYTAVQIRAVRCSADLSTCTAPILISGSDEDVQFSDVTIGPDGRVYVTWAEIIGELPGNPDGTPGQPQTFVVKMRVAQPGSTSFGPTRVVATLEKAIPFDGFLQANDFRVASYPKNAVVMIGDEPRVFVTWDESSERVLDTICEEPVIEYTYSDDFGATWSPPQIASEGGVNYFPTIAADRTTRDLALAWYSTQFDPTFENRQDVVVARINGSNGKVADRKRITKESNETEADPLLGGFFIGDYFEVYAHDGSTWIHFNANYRKELLLDGLLGMGVPVAQQDNYLTKIGL